METIHCQMETKAKKKHLCNFCGEAIAEGELYMKSTHKGDIGLYDWKAHKHCDKLADRLKMYDDVEGVTQDIFIETIHCVHDGLLIGLLPQDEAKKYGDIIQQLRKVRFRDKLWYVIRYYDKLAKIE